MIFFIREIFYYCQRTQNTFNIIFHSVTLYKVNKMHFIRNNLIAFSFIYLCWNGFIFAERESSVSSEIQGFYGQSIIGAKDMTVSLSKIILESYENLGYILEDMSNSTQSKLSYFSNDTFGIFQNIRKFVNDELLRIKSKYENLTELAENKAEMVINHINDTIIEKTKNMELWSHKLKSKLNSFNDSYIYDEKCFLIDKFIEDSLNEMYDCCSIAVNPVKSMCSVLKETITETIDVIVAIMENVERCILEKETYLKYMIPCLNKAYDGFGSLLTKADTIRIGLMDILPVKIIFTDFCIAFVSEAVENRIIYIENDLESQLKFYNYNNSE